MQLLPSNWLGQGSRGSASMARNQNRAGRRAVFVQKHSTQQGEVTCLPDTLAYQAAFTAARDTGGTNHEMWQKPFQPRDGDKRKWG